MPRSYSISAEDIAQESERVGGELEQFDVSRVIRLDELELREIMRGVECEILASELAKLDLNVPVITVEDYLNVRVLTKSKETLDIGNTDITNYNLFIRYVVYLLHCTYTL